VDAQKKIREEENKLRENVAVARPTFARAAFFLARSRGSVERRAGVCRRSVTRAVRCVDGRWMLVACARRGDSNSRATRGCPPRGRERTVGRVANVSPQLSSPPPALNFLQRAPLPKAQAAMALRGKRSVLPWAQDVAQDVFLRGGIGTFRGEVHLGDRSVLLLAHLLELCPLVLL
jgi:hypothetical protein